MNVSHEEVIRLAELARLHLDQKELEKVGSDLGEILSYIDRLQKVDTAGVLEGSMLPQEDFRADEAHPSDQSIHDQIVENFPDRMGDALRVPAVFEKPKG